MQKTTDDFVLPQKEKCDVLIIGGGGAALRAAIAARENCQGRIVVVTKGALGRSGCTALACSDRMAFHATLPYTEPGGSDNWRYHADDIYRLGGRVSDYDLAEILAKGSGEAFAYLDELGMPFAKRPDGRADQFVTDGSIYARACYTGPHTANHIEEALVKKVTAMDIDIIEHCMIADLILSTNDGRVVGTVGVWEDKNEFVIFDAKAVVLGTGGAGCAFKVSVFPEGMTGDGYAIAYRAGAELVNLEFIQFGLSSVKTNLACSGSMMRAIPKWINDEGREFLRDYFPAGTDLNKIYSIIFNKGATWPASADAPSHILDVAVWHENRRGQSVYLDYRANPEDLYFSKVDEKIPQWYSEIKDIDVSEAEFAESPLRRLQSINPQALSWLKERGVDVTADEIIELAPAAQHFQGGVKIRTRGNTTLKGLYAAGEAAGGQHGAMRPGGNSLMDSQVFGKIAGTSAAEEANSLNHSLTDEQINFVVNEIEKRLNAEQGLPAIEMREQVQDILSSYASVVRTTDGLNEGLRKLSEIKSQGLCVDEKGWVYALETLNVLETGMLVLEAARRRPESRGTHLFFKSEDDLSHVPTDEQWENYIILKKGSDGVECEVREPVNGIPNSEFRIPNSSSAMVLHNFKEPLEHREFPLPDLNEGEVLVEISASGICGSDVHMWLGKDPRLNLPMILGHEGVGRIAKLRGERKSVHGTPLQEGDLIIWNRGVTCGKCYFCVVKHTPALCPNRWVYGITTNCAEPPYLCGCYAEYILLTDNTDILKIEEDIDPAILVSAGCSGATMAHAFDLHSPDVGDTVVVQGPGPLGIFAVAFAKSRGASEIVVIGGTQSRLELCRKFGATLIINRHETTVEERRQNIMDLTDSRGADVIIEATGSSTAVAEGVGLVRNGGCYLVTGFGNPEGKVELDCFADISRKNIWLQGVWVSDTKHLLEAVRLVIDNADAFAALAIDKFPLSQATKALEAMRDRKTLKAVIVSDRNQGISTNSSFHKSV